MKTKYSLALIAILAILLLSIIAFVPMVLASSEPSEIVWVDRIPPDLEAIVTVDGSSSRMKLSTKLGQVKITEFDGVKSNSSYISHPRLYPFSDELSANNGIKWAWTTCFLRDTPYGENSVPTYKVFLDVDTVKDHQKTLKVLKTLTGSLILFLQFQGVETDAVKATSTVLCSLSADRIYELLYYDANPDGSLTLWVPYDSTNVYYASRWFKIYLTTPDTWWRI